MNQQVSCTVEPSAFLTPDPEARSSALGARAFEAALLAEQRMLRRRALQMARSPDAADDLVQDTLMLAWAARDSFDGRYMGAWLLRIMRNRFISLVRRPAIIISIEAFDEATHHDDGDGIGFLESRFAEDHATSQPDERLHVAELVALLQSMPDGSRRPLMLKLVEGCSDEEIAARMGLPVGTVKSRIHRLRERLSAAETPNLRKAR